MFASRVLVLAASLVATAPSAAGAAPTKFDRGPAASGVVADGRSFFAAYLATTSALKVLYDRGGTPTFAVPEGCLPAAVRAATVALDCSTPLTGQPTLLLLNVARGTTRRSPQRLELALTTRGASFWTAVQSDARLRTLSTACSSPGPPER